MSALPPQGVFISYRREDTGPYARLLKDHLTERLPGQPVFIDLDEIEIGLDFEEVIKTALDSSAVMVTLIGPKWLTITDEDGRRRLDDPDDYVRFEIRTGLQRCVRLIPVLTDGAKPPRHHDLPGDIQKLARLNALKMSYDHFEYDENRLTTTIRKVLECKSYGLKGQVLASAILFPALRFAVGEAALAYLHEADLYPDVRATLETSWARERQIHWVAPVGVRGPPPRSAEAGQRERRRSTVPLRIRAGGRSARGWL